MISFRNPETRAVFHLRAAGILIHGGDVLLQRLEGEDFWFLPGGRVEWLESVRETVVREFREEMGLDVRVKRLVFVAEDLVSEEPVLHEIAFYYLVECDGGNAVFSEISFAGTEGERKLECRWFPLDELDGLRLFPRWLRWKLNALPATVEHVIHRGGETTQFLLTES
jgi:ADP-ribose pyrophosphatase YjhB (NUDIX family)